MAANTGNPGVLPGAETPKTKYYFTCFLRDKSGKAKYVDRTVVRIKIPVDMDPLHGKRTAFTHLKTRIEEQSQEILLSSAVESTRDIEVEAYIDEEVPQRKKLNYDWKITVEWPSS